MQLWVHLTPPVALWLLIVCHMHVICAAVDPHRILHIDTWFTSAAIALVGRFLRSLPQASFHA